VNMFVQTCWKQQHASSPAGVPT